MKSGAPAAKPRSTPTTESASEHPAHTDRQSNWKSCGSLEHVHATAAIATSRQRTAAIATSRQSMRTVVLQGMTQVVDEYDAVVGVRRVQHSRQIAGAFSE